MQENSFFRDLGHVELDLPEPPEKATRPPPPPVDPYLRFGPKQEISHIFRAPEKLPPKELSLGFSALTLLPFVGFLIGVGWFSITILHLFIDYIGVHSFLVRILKVRIFTKDPNYMIRDYTEKQVNIL